MLLRARELSVEVAGDLLRIDYTGSRITRVELHYPRTEEKMNIDDDSPLGEDPYFNQRDVLSGDVVGRWFPAQYSAIGVSAQLSLNGGTFTGTLYAEYTTDPQRVLGVSRVILPQGSLHTVAVGVALANPAPQIDLTAVADGATFSFGFDGPRSGSMRFVLHRSGGSGSAPQTIWLHAEGAR